MKKTDIPPSLWADLKEAQASMAIEGFDLSDEQLQEVAGDYLKSNIPKKLAELKTKSDREGLDFDELVREAFGFNQPI